MNSTIFQILFLVVIALALNACSVVSGFRYHKISAQNYKPAKTSINYRNTTSSTLVKQGYLLLGYMDRREPVKTCYQKRGCTPFKPKTLLKTRAMQQARLRGADLVTVLYRKPGQERVLKEICTAYTRDSIRSREEPSIRECDDYIRLRGIAYFHSVRFMLWRLAPAQANSAANRAAVKRFLSVSQ